MNNRLCPNFYPFYFQRSTVYAYMTVPPLLDSASYYYMTNIRLTIYRLASVTGNESYN